MQEIWKDIKGFEGKYQVSNLGRVRTLKVHGKDKIIIRKTQKGTNGYVKIDLMKKDGTRKWTHVHRLVAEAFLGESDLVVNHKDENKENNCVTNLEYVTQKENKRYSSAQKIKSINVETGEIKHYGAIRDVIKENMSMRNVWMCLKGRSEKAYGCKWEYETIERKNCLHR